MRKVFVSVLVLSAFVASMDCYGARKRKSSKNARTASIRERSVKRTVSSTASSYSSATSSYSSSLLENLSRFQSSVFGEKLMYGKSYALQDMFTIATHSYYYKNGSQAELKEQFCFGPYMKLTGVGASSSATSSVVEANGSLQCVDLEKDTIYSISLLDATDGQIENALHTSSVSGVVSGDQRVAYVSRSGNPIATQYFNSEKYIDVSEYAKKINEAVATAKSSCGSFKSDMDKLKSQLGFGVALSSGIGVALSGASTGVGIYNIKKTNEVQSTIKKQENMQKNLEEIARSSGVDFQEVKDKSSGKFDVSSSSEKNGGTGTSTSTTENDEKGTNKIGTDIDLTKLTASLKSSSSTKKDTSGSGTNPAEGTGENNEGTATENDEKVCKNLESFKVWCTNNGSTNCKTVKVDDKKFECCGKLSDTDKDKAMKLYSNDDKYYNDCFDTSNSFKKEICYKKDNSGNKTSCDNCDGCEKEPLKNCVELENDWNALSEDAKRRWIFSDAYEEYTKLKKECDVANGKVDTVNKSSEQYKKYVESVDSSMKTSRNLDIVQAGLSGASTIASGVSLGFSVSAIGTVGDAIDELSKCNDAISKLRNVYGEYKAELEADEEE